MGTKMLNLNEIYLGDCLEVMQCIDSKSIDMILCDLPYGMTNCKWDSVIPLDLLWKEYIRVIRDNSAIVLTGVQPFTSTLVLSNLSLFKYEWIWDKHIPKNFINAKIMPMQKHENILVFGKGKLKYFPQMVLRDKPIIGRNYSKKGKDSAYNLNQDGSNDRTHIYTHRNPDTIIVGCWEPQQGKMHPTQKPLSLFEYLIKTYTNEGDLVLDNCAGSGTTGVACQNLRRNFILIENDEKYYNMAKAWLAM